MGNGRMTELHNVNEANKVMPARDSLGTVEDTYKGMQKWFNEELAGNLWSQIGPAICKQMPEECGVRNQSRDDVFGSVKENYAAQQKWFNENIVPNIWSEIAPAVAREK
jgi:hypothetical protein